VAPQAITLDIRLSGLEQFQTTQCFAVATNDGVIDEMAVYAFATLHEGHERSYTSKLTTQEKISREADLEQDDLLQYVLGTYRYTLAVEGDLDLAFTGK